MALFSATSSAMPAKLRVTWVKFCTAVLILEPVAACSWLDADYCADRNKHSHYYKYHS
ncbi:MAG: hypothetical protein PUC50_09270 [Bacteroidales bacterium]|nr:hypothetical protein [Bacteroidales bacterium]